jgi:hypothetical protein
VTRGFKGGELAATLSSAPAASRPVRSANRLAALPRAGICDRHCPTSSFVVALATVVSLGLAIPAFAEVPAERMGKPEMERHEVAQDQRAGQCTRPAGVGTEQPDGGRHGLPNQSSQPRHCCLYFLAGATGISGGLSGTPFSPVFAHFIYSVDEASFSFLTNFWAFEKAHIFTYFPDGLLPRKSEMPFQSLSLS